MPNVTKILKGFSATGFCKSEIENDKKIERNNLHFNKRFTQCGLTDYRQQRQAIIFLPSQVPSEPRGLELRGLFYFKLKLNKFTCLILKQNIKALVELHW